MANKLFYSYIHKTEGTENNSFVPVKMISSYWDSLIFDVNHRTIWHQGMPFGNVYPGTASYGEIFNDIDNNIAKAAYGHAEGYKTKAIYNDGDNEYGIGAHAEGIETEVNHKGAHAEGYKTHAYKEYTHTEGSETEATGISSHAEGNNTKAKGKNSHVEGYLSITSENAQNAHAEGNNTYTDGINAHAEGNGTFANGENSHAEGNNTKANGKNSHTEGYNVQANGENSHAEGEGSQAIGKNSHAEGYYTTANEENSHVEGNCSYGMGRHSHAEGINTYAIGIGSHSEGKNTYAAGSGAHAEGYNVQANGENSHAEGISTRVESSYAHAEGNENTIEGRSDSSHIEGSNNKISQSKSSHVEGNNNKNGINSDNSFITSDYSHIEGENNINCSLKSHVEGNDSCNYGKESHVEGSYNINYATNSHIEGTHNIIGRKAEDTTHIHIGGNKNLVYPNSKNNVIYGHNNKIRGNYNDVNGENINANINYSVLKGNNLEVNSGEQQDKPNINFVNVFGDHISVSQNATYGFAHGSNINLQSPYEVVFGKNPTTYLDTPDLKKQNTIFVIGNGVSGETPSNALDVRENGISYLYKGIYTWDYVEDYPYSTVADINSSYSINKRQLAQVATVTYVMRNSTGRRNFYPLNDEAEPSYTGAEYFNNYGDENTAPNMAYANFCHAEGWGTYCHNGAVYSHAEGCGTETRNPGEHASGNWNSSSENTLFSVGWGTNNINRANAFEIKKAPTSNGIAFVDNKPIVTSILNETGPTYIWKGEYSDYIKINQVDKNTLYFIYDGDASTRNDFISVYQMDDIVNRKVEEKIKQYTQGLLYNAMFNNEFYGFGGDNNFSYVWTGNTTDFSSLGNLVNDPNTIFIIRNK